MNRNEIILTLALATASVVSNTHMPSKVMSVHHDREVMAEQNRQQEIQRQKDIKAKAEVKVEKVTKRIEEERLKEQAELKKQIVQRQVEEKRKVALSRGGHANGPMTFKATAYTLSAADCGKSPSDKAYGITSTGVSLKGLDFRHRKIAVDPNLIPLGSKVWIEYPEDIRYVEYDGKTYDLNGEWEAVDTGGAIRGNIIDVYVGGSNSYYAKFMNKFGVRKVKIYR